MNHISRRTSRFYDIHEYNQFIFRVDFYYNGQWKSNKENQGIGNDNIADTQISKNQIEIPKHKILRFFTAENKDTETEDAEFTYYSVFIGED